MRRGGCSTDDSTTTADSCQLTTEYKPTGRRQPRNPPPPGGGTPPRRRRGERTPRPLPFSGGGLTQNSDLVSASATSNNPPQGTNARSASAADFRSARPRRNDENERGGNYTKSEFCLTPPHEGGARGSRWRFSAFGGRGANPVRRMPPKRDERARRASVSPWRARAQRTRGREGEHFGAGSRSAWVPGWRSDK